MLPDLERLIALQRLDSTAHDAQRRLADVPERERGFEARLDAAKARVTAAKELLTASQTARREIEKNVALHQGRLSKFRDQLMSVKTNVEYQAMQKEIEFAQTEVKTLEDQVLERMLEADDLTAAVKSAEQQLAAEQKAIDTERRTMSAESAQMKAAIEDLAKQRAEIVKAIDPKTLAVFDLVAKRRGGVAVGEARDGICTICHVRLRPQVFNTIRRNDEIVQCDSCQRILYFVPSAQPAPAADSAAPSAQ